MRKMWRADEDVHGSKMLWLALLAILGFELDCRVVNAETFLNDLLQSVEQCVMVVRTIDHDMRGQGKKPRG